MRLHYLQHVPFEDPGSILVWAKQNGHVITHTQLYKNEGLPRQEDFDLLVIMGGPMNIYEEEKYPWLADEKVFIKQAIEAAKVIIGLCLGAQLIADVIGGKVTKNTYKEIGWYEVRLDKEARTSPLFAFFPEALTVFQWHGDTFSVLPEDALCIAQNEVCIHQAFIYKRRVFGFQYHLENTADIIKSLIENCKEDMTPGAYVQSAEEILAHTDYMIQNNMWMDRFLTQLEKMYRKGVL
jgi:GMP synthase-like glutamine amidotransferase